MDAKGNESFGLRLIEIGDAELLAAFYARNAGYHRAWSPTPPPGFFSAGFHHERLVAYTARHACGEEYRFVITAPDPLVLVIGVISLTAVERGVFQNGRLGYSIDSEWRGRGVMTGSIRLVARFAFDELGLHRLEANIMPHNIASRRVLQKCGFSQIGFSPRMVKINGEWHDHEMYALLNENAT